MSIEIEREREERLKISEKRKVRSENKIEGMKTITTSIEMN